MIEKSQYNGVITPEYLHTAHENQYFDRKSAKIRPSDLAKHISAFANAGGGTIAIGFDDKTLGVEGINCVGEDKLNDLISSPKNCCKPMPEYKYEILNCENCNGNQDRILLLHIKESIDQIIRTSNDTTWLRIGDRSIEMRGDDLRNLEYVKNARHYEDEIHPDATMEDLDEELLAQYAERIGANKMPYEDILAARGFIRKKDGKLNLTNGAVLLFAKNIYQFYPNCRIRFLRYDGNFAQVGMNINLIRDKSIEFPLLRIIDEAKRFISTQLREFTMLNSETGKFEIVPEYPEFAWQEGIVNAVTHREYAMTGNYIKVTMFDDRLEIESPGRLPSIVTVDNIRETRFSRNPRISRVLTEMGWVRELNEGVKRIYSDMEKFFLEDPVYSEPEQSVRLILKNNIVVRSARRLSHLTAKSGIGVWEQLDKVEKDIMVYLMNSGNTSRKELAVYTKKSDNTVRNRLNHLMELQLVKAEGSLYDPNRTYSASL